ALVPSIGYSFINTILNINHTATTIIDNLSLHVALPIFLEGTLQAVTSAVSDKLLDLVRLGSKSAADKGKDTRDYLYRRQTCHQRSEERFSRNAETDLVCRLLLEKKKYINTMKHIKQNNT